MTNDGHERWREDLAAYVLGALEPAEAAGLEGHLKDCERCRAEVRWLKPAVEALPESVARLEPPSALRVKLLAQVWADSAEAEGARSGERARRGLGARLRGAGLALTSASAAAAMALVAAAGLIGYAIGNGGSGGGGVRTTTAVAGHAPGITARLLRAGDKGVLRLTHVRQLDGGRVLEAWVERNGKVAPVRALFVPNRGGLAEAVVGDVGGADAVLVTVERRGGVAQPTSEPIVAVPLKD